VRSSGQYSFALFGGPRFTEADFREAPSNAEACAWLRRTPLWPEDRLALWGEAGRGKTHLLHIWAARRGADLRSGANVSGFTELPSAGIAIDDADTAEETGILHLLNAARELRVPMLLAARTPPARWSVSLPDLASRLRSMPAVAIGAPEDELLRFLLSRHLTDRQLRVPQAVQEWLVRRLPRSAAALGGAVARLDSVALAERRNITMPFATEVLADILGSDGSSLMEDGETRL
jgi:chromosomal replication initiation ATPase DnaA